MELNAFTFNLNCLSYCLISYSLNEGLKRYVHEGLLLSIRVVCARMDVLFAQISLCAYVCKYDAKGLGCAADRGMTLTKLSFSMCERHKVCGI